jgi:tetrapyrrole methylase family protein/MazG family protein
MIYVVGLGPGDPGLISRSAWELLTRPDVTVVLRTSRHKAAAALREAGVSFSTYDHLYTSESDFAAVYQRIADMVLAVPGEVVYAVPGSPCVAEATVSLIKRGAEVCARAIRILPAVALAELDHREFTHEDTVYIPPCRDTHHLGSAMETLARLMDILQGEQGCPWDREQTHLSLRPYLIEEAYEVLEAIDNDDSAALAEELGDLLLQVVFHAHIAERENRFDLVDCIEAISRKLIRRHPHVFNGLKVSGTDEVLVNWQRIKQSERETGAREGLLDGIPKGLPALAEAYKLQHKAKQVGFDWPNIEGAWNKLREELRELEVAIDSHKQAEITSEAGDALFSLVNVCRFINVEPETALREASRRFKHRFDEVARLSEEKGLNPAACGLEMLDRLWDEVKRRGL